MHLCERAEERAAENPWQKNEEMNKLWQADSAYTVVQCITFASEHLSEQHERYE